MTTSEPTDVGPAAGGDLRASDSDRGQVLELLASARAEGRITAAEYDERAAVARRAQVFDDLIPLTRDLVPRAPRPAGTAVARVDPAGADPSTDAMVAIFGGVNRKGTWRVRRRSRLVATFGGIDLDFTDAIFEADVCELEIWCLFGGINAIVPEGVRVEAQGVVSVFGGVDTAHASDSPGGPLLIIKGFCSFGGVDVRLPRVKRGRGRR